MQLDFYLNHGETNEVKVIKKKKRILSAKFKFSMRPFAFHLVLIPLWKDIYSSPPCLSVLVKIVGAVGFSSLGRETEQGGKKRISSKSEECFSENL